MAGKRISEQTDGTALTLDGTEIFPASKTVLGSLNTYRFKVQQILSSGLPAILSTLAVGTGSSFGPASEGVLTVNNNAIALHPFTYAGAGEVWLARIGGVDAKIPVLAIDGFGAPSAIVFERANGTAASKSALLSGDEIGAIGGHGYMATTYSRGAGLVGFFATENWTDSANGTETQIWGTPTGSSATGGLRVFAKVRNDIFMFTGNNAGFGVAAGSGSVAQFVGADGLNPIVNLDAFGVVAPSFLGRQAGGTLASKTASASAAITGAFVGQAWNSIDAYNTIGGMQVRTTEINASGAHGSQIALRTTAIGATTVTDTLIINGPALASTTTTTGAGVLTGGFGLTGAIFAGGNVNTAGQLISSVATGTAPLSVASTTVVANLNASSLGGATFAAPGAIGGGTPGSGAFTTLSATTSVKTPIIFPTSDGTSAIEVTKADGSTVIGMWDTTNGRLNIGPNVAPSHLLTVMANTAATVAEPFVHNVHIVGADAATAGVLVDTFGSLPSLSGRRANGTLASKTGVVSADILLTQIAYGWDTSVYGIGSNVQYRATETWSASAHGGQVAIRTVAATTTTPADTLVVNGTGLASTSKTTGAAVVTGGLGVSGAIFTDTLNIITPATDAAHTDNTLCWDTTTGLVLKGSGAAGICLGTSSERYKHDIAALPVGLEALTGLRPVSYRYNASYGDPSKDLYGFVAEQVYDVLPQLVGLDAQGRPNSVDWAGIVPITVRAIQQLKSDNDDLRSALEKLKQQAA